MLLLTKISSKTFSFYFTVLIVQLYLTDTVYSELIKSWCSLVKTFITEFFTERERYKQQCTKKNIGKKVHNVINTINKIPDLERKNATKNSV